MEQEEDKEEEATDQADVDEEEDDEDDGKSKFSSVLQRNFDQIEMRDILLKMLGLCTSFSFADSMTGPNDLKKMVKTMTPTITDMLTNSCFVESKSCKAIMSINWPQGVSDITFRSDNCIPDEAQLKEEIKK